MIKARDFKIELTIASYGEKGSVSSLVKSASMEVEGDAMMSADKARQIIKQLCKLLAESLSDSEIEEAINQ